MHAPGLADRLNASQHALLQPHLPRERTEQSIQPTYQNLIHHSMDQSLISYVEYTRAWAYCYTTKVTAKQSRHQGKLLYLSDIL